MGNAVFNVLIHLMYIRRVTEMFCKNFQMFVIHSICLAFILGRAKKPQHEVRVHCKRDPIYVLPEIKLRGLVPDFHIQQNRWPTREYINRSQIHEWRNWESGRAVFISGNICFEFSGVCLQCSTSQWKGTPQFVLLSDLKLRLPNSYIALPVTLFLWNPPLIWWTVSWPGGRPGSPSSPWF